MSTLSFHLFLPQMRMTHDAIVERALAAEAAGFEGMSFMDHLAPPMALDQDMWEAMSIAGWVLARTSTLKVGHLVLCDSFRHPAVLARQVTSPDVRTRLLDSAAKHRQESERLQFAAQDAYNRALPVEIQ